MSSSRDDFGIAIRSALLQRGARQKFSLFFLICFAFLIFFIDNYPNNYLKTTRSLINDTIYKVSNLASSPSTLFSFLIKKSKIHFSIYEENKILKKEIEEFKSKDFNMKYLLTENKKLQFAVGSNEKLKSYSNITAKVILDKDSPYLKSIIINRGSRNKVKKGMPVLEGNNLIGRVVEINYFSSRVLLLNDLNSRIPVFIEDSGTQAIMTGVGKKNPILAYLPDQFLSDDGLTIFTSGKDEIFLPGIPIGKILNKDGGIQVKLFFFLYQLNFVRINLQDLSSLKNTIGRKKN